MQFSRTLLAFFFWFHAALGSSETPVPSALEGTIEIHSNDTIPPLIEIQPYIPDNDAGSLRGRNLGSGRTKYSSTYDVSYGENRGFSVPNLSGFIGNVS